MSQPVTIQNDWLAAILSYLIPGLGQVLQGRIGKGILFFVSLYTLFFYGMAMGAMKNVWLPSQSALVTPAGQPLPDLELVGRLRLFSSFKPLAYRPQFLGQFWIGLAAWPAVAHYLADSNPEGKSGLPLIGRYMATPSEEELQTLQRDGNKRWDLAWVYTLIAGVLNLLVIYDAFAGPAVKEPNPSQKSREGEASNPAADLPPTQTGVTS
jgi:hypothetical protein